MRALKEADVILAVGCRFSNWLGFGHPFANSLKMAYPDRQVINVTGDGAFGFTLQELETAQRHGLNVVHVIHNDRAWGMCKFGQEILFGTAEKIDQVLSDTDWARIAEGFGCFGEKGNTC